MATKKIIAIASEIPTCRFVSCSSSSTDWLAAIIRARTPIASDWPSTMTPRRTGLRRMGCRSATDSMCVGLDVDVARRATHGDRPVAGAAHHHPFDDGLAAVEVRGCGG